MKYTTKQLNIYYAQVFLNSFSDEHSHLTERQQFETCYQTFLSEHGWNVKRVGKNEAFQDWLQGLPTACSIPYCNYDILEMARDTEHLTRPVDTDKNEYKILDNYWNFMACKFFFLLDRTQEWFDKNLTEKG